MEQALRGKISLQGFVAYMKRKDAETAVQTLDGADWGGIRLKVGFSKPVPIPSKALYGKWNASQIRFPLIKQRVPLASPVRDLDLLLRNDEDQSPVVRIEQTSRQDRVNRHILRLENRERDRTLTPLHLPIPDLGHAREVRHRYVRVPGRSGWRVYRPKGRNSSGPWWTRSKIKVEVLRMSCSTGRRAILCFRFFSMTR